MSLPRRIIFFDGVCNLCSGFINFIMRHDPEGTFRVASIQGKTAEEALTAQQRGSLSSVLYWKEGQIESRSTAVLHIVSELPGWGWVRSFLLVPPFVRDPLYEWIARNRYRLFGRRDTCRLPAAAERQRFLD